MRWRDRRPSENVEDRHRIGGGKIALGGLGSIVARLYELQFRAEESAGEIVSV